MSITPTGPYSIPLAKLREHIAASATFQARLGVTTAAAALHKIIGSPREGDDLDDLRPFACVSFGDDWDYQTNGGGARNEFAHTGSLTLYVTDRGRREDAHEDELDWGNFCGGLIEDLAAIAALSDNLVISNIRQTQFGRSDVRKDAAKGFSIWDAAWTISYGDE